MNEDRLRFDLTGLADEVTPVDLRDRALRTSRRLSIQRAVTTSAAALVMIAAATGTALAIRPNGQADPPTPATSVTVTPTEVTPTEVTPTPERSATASPQSEQTGKQTPTTPPPEAPALVLGPDGLGLLKLGMTKRQAEATGMISDFVDLNKEAAPRCPANAELKGGEGNVLLSTRLGVAAIVPPKGVKTVEGIRVGSSRASLLRAYPSWRPVDGMDSVDEGRGLVAVPGNSDAVYRIEVRNGTVRSITLQFDNQDCYE